MARTRNTLQRWIAMSGVTALAALAPSLETSPLAAQSGPESGAPEVAAEPAPADATPAPMAEPVPAIEAPAWNALQLQTRRFLVFAGSLEMSRDRVPYPGDGPHHGRTVTRIRTRSGATALGTKLSTIHTTSYVDPATGRSIEFVEHKLEERWKQVTFGPDGFHLLVRRPADGQAKEPPDTWPVDNEYTKPYVFEDGTPAPPGEPVRDYYNMIGDLGRRVASGAEAADYLVVTKGRVVRFRVELGEEVRRDWSLADLSAEGLEEKRPLLLRRLTIRPLVDDPGEIGGFFAMEGGTEIWVESGTGLVVLIAGEMPKIPGRTEIKLTGASFPDRSLADALAD